MTHSKWTVFLALFLGLPAIGQEYRVAFRDVTSEAGLFHVQNTAPGSCVSSLCEPEAMTGGAAVGDVDGDGALDLYVTRIDTHDVLYRNLGDGTFVDATLAAGLARFDLHSNGAAFGDIDNDGDADLFVTVLGDDDDRANSHYYLFLNDGSGAFEDRSFTNQAAMLGPGVINGWSPTFGDYDRDGYLDLHVTQWFPSLTSRARLLRNRGAVAPGYFEDQTVLAGVDLTASFSFSSTFVDLDGDGWQDLAVAADFETSRLFWNNADGTFTETTAASGVGTDENGMGSTFGDFDADGDLDWFVTSIFDPDSTCDTSSCNWGYTGNRLYRNEGGRVFTDATDLAGVRDGAWGWGTVFFDYDNDGDLDLVMTNGVRFPTNASINYEHDRMRFWSNDGTGQMTEMAAALNIDDDGSGKGLLTFDYDADGDLDVLVLNNGEEARLFENEGGNANDWLRVDVVGNQTNRDGIGARVSVWKQLGTTPQIREIGVASHFLGQSERTAHFGLGPTSRNVARVEVHFPATGITHQLDDVAPNQVLVVTE